MAYPALRAREAHGEEGEMSSSMDMQGMDMDTTLSTTSTTARATASSSLKSTMQGMDMDTTLSTTATTARATAPLSLKSTSNAALASAIQTSVPAVDDHDAMSMTEGAMSMSEGAMSMSGMSTSFHVGLGDPIWSSSFQPNSQSAYGGAIVLLFLLAIAQRFFFFAKDKVGSSAGFGRRRAKADSDKFDSENGFVGEKQARYEADLLDRENSGGWHVHIAKALMQLIGVAIGYLLMLAVMTFNAGYLLGILGGTLVGELIFSMANKWPIDRK